MYGEREYSQCHLTILTLRRPPGAHYDAENRVVDHGDNAFISSQDVFSYRREQARGRTEDNIITVVMDIYDLDVDEAVDWVERRHRELEREFIEKHDKVPKFGEPVDAQVERYIEGLAHWVWANAMWSFECGRYFGEEGLEIMKKTKWVGPVPKERV